MTVTQSCRNPETVEVSELSTCDKTEELTAGSSCFISCPSNLQLQSENRNTPLVVPKFVRVSSFHRKTVRPDASMAEEDGAKRRFDAQVDFPRKNHTSNTHSTQHHQNGSHRSGTQQPRYHPQQQPHPRTSPSASCNSSLPSSRISAKKQQSLGGSINSASASSANNIHPTPLFQRLVSEEVQELKAYARIIETQNRRLAELERVHGDLEARLEVQSNRRMELEKTLEDRERNWAEQIEELKKDKEEWKKLVHVERTKNARLMDQVVRKDQDIHRMLQRKYDHQQRHDAANTSIRNAPRTLSKSSSAQVNGETTPKNFNAETSSNHESPQVILNANGSPADVRERNVANVLLDFFGL